MNADQRAAALARCTAPLDPKQLAQRIFTQRADLIAYEAALTAAEQRITQLTAALEALLNPEPHDTFEGMARGTRIVHHRPGCPGCATRRTARAALAEPGEPSQRWEPKPADLLNAKHDGPDLTGRLIDFESGEPS